MSQAGEKPGFARLTRTYTWASKRTGVFDAALLRAGKALEWTTSYIWMAHEQRARIQEAASTKCLTFRPSPVLYPDWLVALQILVNDLAGSNVTIEEFLYAKTKTTLYQNRVEGSGEQALEAVPSRPYCH
ncbi:hypothetical protein V8E53_009055 [Lactarius tabidus]